MNPPSILYGAMNKDRKPFTYTPGGLDLSEIKSERMAKRLMRNAMSQGVPESSAQILPSHPVSISAGVLPNYNCLPVQVFPTLQLPPNPKSLLRTRSNPNPQSREPYLTPIPSAGANGNNIEEDNKYQGFDIKNAIQNDMPESKHNYSQSNDSTLYQSKNDGSNDHSATLPKQPFDIEDYETDYPKKVTDRNTYMISKTPLPETDIGIASIPVTLASPLHDTYATNDSEQKEVKVIQKETKTESETNQNGDTEAAVVVKLPAKTSAAKTETKVEISKKTLTDGTIQEIKTTTTKTTIDGKTKITTETETRTIPKKVEEVAEEVEETEEEIDEEVIDEEQQSNKENNDRNEHGIKQDSIKNGLETEEITENIGSKDVKTDKKTNGHIITGEEKSETTTKKNVVVIQSVNDDSEEEIEEVEEEEEEADVEVEEVVILKKPENKSDTNEIKTTDVAKSQNTDKFIAQEETKQQKTEEEQGEQYEEVEEDNYEEKFTDETKVAENELNEEKTEIDKSNVEEESKTSVDDGNEEEVEEEFEEAEETEIKKEESDEAREVEEKSTKIKEEDLITSNDTNNELIETENEIPVYTEKENEPTTIKEEKENVQEQQEILHKIKVEDEPKLSFREPSIPFEKVEDIEIKPIGPAQEVIKKLHTEIITTTTDKPSGALSTQTEINRVENIVMVNRTTKTLDHAYGQAQESIPTLKTYFSPNNDRNLSSPQSASRPFQIAFPSESQNERRHSLLLDRLSVDRQINAPDIYQNNYQHNHENYELNQWAEPQSEVLTVSNVKPSTISKNQQWYNHVNRESTISSAVSPAPILPSQHLGQSYIQAQPQIPVQQKEPQYQNYSQSNYVSKPDFQPYVENNLKNTYKDSSDFQQSAYSTYSPKPAWTSNSFDSKPVNPLPPPLQPSQYSSIKKDSTENYQNTSSFSSLYVPPPWEQDSSYVPENQNYYQPSQSSMPFTSNSNPSWKPKPSSKFSKNSPTSYVPPAPNQSFVKPVTGNDCSKLPGTKTYYSEYERRYISVPESTYIPSETKLQQQPDPSPQYYYDNNEPTEIVEPQWRKELREFTEKTSEISKQYDKSSIRPPWEDDPKYVAPTEYNANVAPSWTQTLQPRTWRERSYEPEYIGSRTNTLGRGRPQSSYVKSNVGTIQERPRGMSVDRYNPNNYQTPLASEHPPVQSHTLNPNIHPKSYHNPTVPAYHSRASAEPREQASYPHPRHRVESKVPPVQSRSFKYLQWITGTED